MTDEPTEDMNRNDPTLGEMSHTNPYTGRVFGDTQTYSRGRTVAADGGEANTVSRPSSDASDRGKTDSTPETETLGDVRHTPPGENDGAQRAYDRGADR